MDKPRRPKTGSTPMNVDPRTASRMGNLPAGGSKNIRQSKIKDVVKNIKNRPFGGGEPTPEGDVDKSGNIVGRKAKKNNGGPPTKGGDVDPMTGDLIDHIIHEIAFTRQGRAARAVDQVEPSAPIPPKSKVSDDMMNKALKKAMDQYKPKPKPNDQTPPGMNTESVENAGHTVHVNVNRTGFRKLERMIASLDGYKESDYSDGKARFYFDTKKHDSAERKKAAEFIKKTRGAEFSHAVKESVQKAGHPESYELGLDKDTTDNKEYQRILRHKRIVRAAMMSDPNHPHHDTDDVSQDDVVAADKAARGRKFNPRNVGKDAY